MGHYPGRYEAEAMQLDGYTVRDITPAEDASGGKAVTCPVAQCAASFPTLTGAPGWYTLHVEYFDTSDGAARYRVTVNGQQIDQWTAAHAGLDHGHCSHAAPPGFHFIDAAVRSKASRYGRAM